MIVNLSEKQINSIIDGCVKKMKEEQKNNLMFRKTVRFHYILEQLTDELKKNENVFDDEYNKGFLFGDVTNNEYLKFFYSAIEGENLKTDIESDFPTEYINKYGIMFEMTHGIMFEMTHGQGTLHRCYLKKEDEKEPCLEAESYKFGAIE